MAGAPSLKIVALSASVSVSLPPLLSSPFSLSAGPQMIRKSRGIVLARSAAQRRSEYQMCEGIFMSKLVLEKFWFSPCVLEVLVLRAQRAA